MEGRYGDAAYLAAGARSAERMDCPGSEPEAGNSGSGRSASEGLDEHLVESETRWEVIQGARVQASPARPPHADQHFKIDYVLGASLAPGYVGATDLLTRWSSDDDYATDTSVRRDGTEPATGERHLEEMVFEVAYSQRRGELETRARLLSRCGVRRLFAVFVKEGTVEEWSGASDAWEVLDVDGAIEDRCLSAPLPVRALLDAAAADMAVAQGLIARGNPVIEEHAQAREASGYRRGKTDGKREGKLEGQREALHRVLARRKLVLTAQQRARVEACEDPALLDRWLDEASTATHTDEIFLGQDDE
jgi:hypothetical protein